MERPIYEKVISQTKLGFPNDFAGLAVSVEPPQDFELSDVQFSGDLARSAQASYRFWKEQRQKLKEHSK
jgi:hypothetical protein